MKKTLEAMEVIIVVGYLALGLFIGLRAMNFYQANVTDSEIFKCISLLLATAIVGFIGNKLREHIICAIVLAIIAFFSVKILAWGAVWLTCLVQACWNAIVIVCTCIAHIIKMITS